jgi:glycosyltransferase involved in cell wall biosynthesis
MVGGTGRSDCGAGVIYFVTPAWQRFDLTRVVLEQRRMVIDWLAERDVEAQCAVVADDANAEIALELGFDVVRSKNYALGRKFNDGIEWAARNGAEWIVPIGSDSFIDPVYLFPLPDPGVLRSSTVYAVAEPSRLGRLRSKMPMGVGPYMIPRAHLPKSLRPSAEYRRRGVDTSTMKGLRRGWTREMVDLHPWQYVGFRRHGVDPSHPQMNSYDKLYARIGVGEEYEVADRLSEFYPPRLVERALAACSAAVEVAA